MVSKKLQHLDISGNKIGDYGVRDILRRNHTLTELKLCDCGISAKGNCNYITTIYK